jgi:hypothetical protein
MNKSEPLGLPTGSVRALVVLFIVAAACAQFILGRPDPGLSVLAAVVATFYFIKRSGDPLPEDVPDPVVDLED